MSQNPTDKTVCIANIGPQEQRRRLTFGLIALAFGLGLAGFLIVVGANPWWRTVLFLPFVMAGIGYFQARDKTWVSLAARGTRNMDTGIESIEDQQVLAQVRRQARQVYIRAVAAAVALTVLFLLIAR